MRMLISLVALPLVSAAPLPQGDDPLLRPIEPVAAARWLTAQAPINLFGNSYLVGFAGLNVALIRTSAGLILIDGAVPQAVPEIEANIRRLGFSLGDVKLILSTEPHWDHAGGLAALARDTGATVIAGRAAGPALRSGRNDPADPQAGNLAAMPPVERLRLVRDGERIRLGDVTVIARATPGHTAGSTSWTWQSCEGERCARVVFAASLNPVSADDYRFSEPAHRNVVADYRRSFARMRQEPCDILLTSHPDQSGGPGKYARLVTSRDPNPFLDPGACRRYADASERRLDDQLRDEMR